MPAGAASAHRSSDQTAPDETSSWARSRSRNVVPAPPRVRPRSHAAPKRTRRPRSTPATTASRPCAQLVVDDEAGHERQGVGFDEHPLEDVGAVALDGRAARSPSAVRPARRWRRRPAPTSSSAASESIPGPTSGKPKTSPRVTSDGGGQGVPGAPDDDHVVLRQAEDLELVERLDLAQRADHDVDVAGPQARRELAPWRDDDAQPQPGMLRVEATDHRGDERGAAPRPDADAQLAELQALGQADLPVEVAGAGVERRGVAQQQATHVGELDPARAAVEQRGADLGLQRLDAARQGRLGDVATPPRHGRSCRARRRRSGGGGGAGPSSCSPWHRD